MATPGTAPRPARSTVSTAERSGMTGRRPTSAGPPPVFPAAAFTGLFIGSLVVLAVFGNGTFPSPDAEDPAIQSFFSGSADALRIAATLQVAAGVPLAVLAAVVGARLQMLGARAAGSTIALSGGLLAAVFLLIGGLATWTLSRPEVVDGAPLVRSLHALAFASGGPAHVAGLGLFVAGIAVPALLLHLLPRWLAWVGLVLAVLAETSILALAFAPAGILLPLARFPIMAWLLTAAVLLPVTRPRAVSQDGTPMNGDLKTRDKTNEHGAVRP